MKTYGSFDDVKISQLVRLLIKTFGRHIVWARNPCGWEKQDVLTLNLFGSAVLWPYVLSLRKCLSNLATNEKLNLNLSITS